MNAARRSSRRKNWPRGLYEPRPGYLVWRHPDGRTFALGAIPVANAIHQAMQANAHVIASKPSLVDRLTGQTNTIGMVLDRMPTAENKNTAATLRTIDKRIREALGDKTCLELTVADCAAVIEALIDEGKERTAQAVRSRLIMTCRRGMELGWMDANPAEITRAPDPEVKRGRLTLESFKAIYDKAPEAAGWLQRAMRLALVTGQDRHTVVNMRAADVVEIEGERCLIVWRSKTRKSNKPVAIPLGLTLHALGWKLADILDEKTGIESDYLVHHLKHKPNAPLGAPIFEDRVSKVFTEARALAGIPDEGAPTFHEIRSLSKRLYDKQGDVDTKALLGHKTERAADIYADPRGVEAIRVRTGLNTK